MMLYIKKHQVSILLYSTISIILIEIILKILYGYTSGSLFIALPLGIMPGLRILLVLICATLTIWLFVKHQYKIFFTLSWIFLTIIGFAIGKIPMGNFDTLGGMLSIYNANPKQVLNDSRMLADEYPTMTCIGFPERFPCNNPIPREKLPHSIQSLYAGQVLILDNFILIEKFGLQGVFRGFVIFREGFDPWKKENSITRNGCSYCWKIRIIDGLYWYHANPSDPPIFTTPLH